MGCGYLRFLQRSLMGLFLLSVTAGLLAVAGYSVKTAIDIRNAEDNRPRTVRERIFAADVMTLNAGRIAPELTAFGEVRSRRSLELRASATGTIVERAENFEDGAEVAAGQLLLRTDPADAQAARDVERTGLLEAEAELSEAERALELARDDLAAAAAQATLREQALARQRNLGERGLGTAVEREAAEFAASSAAQAVLSRRQALAQAEARLNTARTALERQKIALAEAERGLSQTELRAEFSGTLSGVTAVQGGLISANEKLGELIDPTALEVSFRVSTAQYARLLGSDGTLLRMPVAVTLDVFGTEILAEGQVSRVGAAVGEGTTGRLIFAGLTEARGFRPGDFVTVRVVEPELDGVALVPAAAVDPAGTVLALGAEDRLEQIPVEVLRRQGDDVILRVDALEGHEIVTERSPLLGAGIRVRPERGADAGAAAQPAAEADMVNLTPERRAQLVALIEANERMPAEAKARVLAQLEQDRVPAAIIARIEARAGG
jgi:multidrug efflux pump subunit AcrA (membrane-fusion protein)